MGCKECLQSDFIACHTLKSFHNEDPNIGTAAPDTKCCNRAGFSEASCPETANWNWQCSEYPTTWTNSSTNTLRPNYGTLAFALGACPTKASECGGVKFLDFPTPTGLRY